jgi:hypothetical protein
MDIDSQNDLALTDADAENVVGGTKKKQQKKQHKAVHPAAPRMINVQGPPSVPVSDAPPQDDCDPDAAAAESTV